MKRSRQRKHVTLYDVKACDLVETGDPVHFTYAGREHVAHVTRMGRLRAADGREFAYPSAWTKWCVGPETGTNPSCFGRLVFPASDGKTFHQLRDEWLQLSEQAFEEPAHVHAETVQADLHAVQAENDILRHALRALVLEGDDGPARRAVSAALAFHIPPPDPHIAPPTPNAEPLPVATM